MLEWLLKYPLEWFADGHIVIAWRWALWALAVAGAAVALLWLGGYRRLRQSWPSFTLRVLLTLILLFTLARPTLLVDAPEPVRGHVAVLLDDSLSMRLPGADGRSAAQQMAAVVGDAPGSLDDTLAARMDLRHYRFGAGIEPAAQTARLRYGDARSELGLALHRVATGAEADSLTAVVVVSDGVGGALRERLDPALLTLRARGIPVHVLAPATTTAQGDLELSALRLPSRILVGDRVDIEMDVTQRGLSSRTVSLVIEDDGLIVDRHRLTLPKDRERLRIRRRVTFDGPGRRLLTARLSSLPEESVVQNNRLERSIAVDDEPLRVLHFEGEPRFEVKFIRRAVAEDPVIRLASLVRTAENKYYRLGVEEAAELANGFPDDTAELLRYDVLILGSVEASLLTPVQQSAIRAFVERRGGGLLLLGGSGAFAEGGHARSVLAELAPVALEDSGAAFRREVRAIPTPAGRLDPVLDFGPAGDIQRFEHLPTLMVLNPHRRAKPGATVLLEGDDKSDEPLILLARQNYGRGRVMSFAVSDSWRWQMSVADPVEDQTHETLWRQLLRDLGREAGERVRLSLAETQTTPGQPIAVEALGLDSRYRPAAQAELSLAVTTPHGDVWRYPMSRSAGQDARRQAQFIPEEAGRYDLAVSLSENGQVVATAKAQIDVSTTGSEFHGLAQGRPLLERIAEETGGRLFEAAQAEQLAGLVDDTLTTDTVRKRLPLWDAPILLLAALMLACADWALRRSRGLA